MKICLVRHGETDWNVAGRLQGSEDIPLNANGILQAEECALALRGMEWAAVISSPLKRAAQTAERIAHWAGLPQISVESLFTERDYGKASGLTAEQRAALYPDGDYEGMEDWDRLNERAMGALRAYAERFRGKNIVIVSHGGIINAILATLTNHEAGSGKTRLKNACVSMLSYENSRIEIDYYNKLAREL